MRLRLFHARDGARVAYREAGTGPPLVLLHSARLSHREFEPVVCELADRFRLLLPDLPLHGDSEDRPHHPYTLDWLADVVSDFAWDAGGRRVLVAGHGEGAEIALHAVATGRLRPHKLVLMPTRLHRPATKERLGPGWRVGAGLAAVPGLDRVTALGARLAFRPEHGMALTARNNPAARDLVRHALADVGRNSSLARSWARFARRWPAGQQRHLLEAYPTLNLPVLLLWADQDRYHPLATAEEALDLLPDAQLRVLQGTGFLLAYDDPVGVARELKAFCLKP